MLTLMLYASAVSAVIGLGVWLIERFVSGRKLATRWLWLGALGAMVLVTVLPASRANVNEASQASAPLRDGAARATGPDALPAEVRSLESVGMAANAAPRAVTTDVILLGVWFTLSVAGLLVLGGSAYRIARMQRGWRTAEIAGVPVMLSHDVGPAIVGLIHHGVVMPTWVEALPPVQQRLIVTHEREHLRAGDPLLLWSATLLVVLFPWNPAMWLALRGLRHAIEIDCDTRVLASQPDTREYCSLLLDVGERTLAGVAPMAALAEPSTLLERRIEVMTSRLGTSAKSAAALAAGVLLLAAACVAPRTQLAPRRDALSLVQELSGLLRSDSVAASIPRSDRDGLAARLRERPDTMFPRIAPPGARAAAMDSTTNYGVERRSHTEWEARLVPSIDDAIAKFYPGLRTSRDRTRQLVVLTYSDDGRIASHQVMSLADAIAASPAIEDLDVIGPKVVARFSERGTYQAAIHHERPSLNASVLVRIKRGPIRTIVKPSQPALAEVDSDSAPPPLQFSRRVDSLARADYPAAFAPNDDAYVVLALFTRDGKIVRKDARRFRVEQVFDSLPGFEGLETRKSTYLMRLMGVGERQEFFRSGSTYYSRTPHTLLMWGMIEP